VLSASRLATKIFSRERVMCWSPQRRSKSLFFDTFQSRANEILHAAILARPLHLLRARADSEGGKASQGSEIGTNSMLGSRQVTP
jgi:hypothetical protein